MSSVFADITLLQRLTKKNQQLLMTKAAHKHAAQMMGILYFLLEIILQVLNCT